jgi:hypothetical protein
MDVSDERPTAAPDTESEPDLDVSITDDVDEDLAVIDDIEVPIPDAIDQARPLGTTEAAPRSITDDIEVPIADALDQARPVPLDDEDDGYGRS